MSKIAKKDSELYRIKQHLFEVPFKENKGEVIAKFLPAHFNLTDGVWECRLDSITLKCKKVYNVNTVFTVRANLSENFESKNFEPVPSECPELFSFANCNGFITVPTCFCVFEVKLKSQFCFVRNPSLDWFMVEAKPYNSYRVFINVLQGLPPLPNFEADFVLDWRFRRVI